MVKIDLKGVHSTHKYLANGTKKIYWYAWKGGPKLQGEFGSDEFLESLVAARSRRFPKNQLGFVIVEYKTHDDFTTLAPRTKSDYTKCIRYIENEFATLPIAALDSPKIHSTFIKWRNKLDVSDKWKDYCLSVLFIILSFAKREGHTHYTKPDNIKKKYRADRSDAIWLEDDIRAFARAAPERVWTAFVLALDTGQRQGDLIRLPWTAYDGEWIRLARDRRLGVDARQGKTKASVEIPVTRDLKEILDGLPHIGPTILVNSEGKPYTSGAIQKAIGDAKRKAGIVGLTFHDLRGTAVTRLAEAGCTTPEISSITGHTLESVEKILKAYLGRTRGLALEAIRKLEQKRER